MNKLEQITNKILLCQNLSKPEWDYIKKNILNETSLNCFDKIYKNYKNINIQYSWRVIPNYFNNEESIRNFGKYIEKYQIDLENNVDYSELTLFNSFSTRILKNKNIPSKYKIPFLYYLPNNEITLKKLTDQDLVYVIEYWLKKDNKTNLNINYNMMYIILESLTRNNINNIVEILDNNFKYHTLGYTENLILMKSLFKSSYFLKMTVEQYYNLLNILAFEINEAKIKYGYNKHWKTLEKINNLNILQSKIKDAIYNNLSNRNDSIDKLGSLLL